jgi:redox-sensitive bicupin YhaK (pirin superfamily)
MVSTHVKFLFFVLLTHWFTLFMLSSRSHLVSDVNSQASTPIKINQDANIFVSEVSSNHQLEFTVEEGRQAYLLLIEGSAMIKDSSREDLLEQHDAVEIYGKETFQVLPVSSSSSPSSNASESVCTTSDKVHVLLVEMAYTGEGRTDL